MTVSTPIIVSGFFRSGTSITQDIIKKSLPDGIHFYEPLHGLMRDWMDQEDNRFFPYKNLLFFSRLYTQDYDLQDLYLSENDEWPQLRFYLYHLYARARSIKFTRTSMRLGWLASLFPEAKVIVILRDPRAQYHSIHNYKDPEEPLFGDPYLTKRYYEYFKARTEPPCIATEATDDVEQFFLFWKLIKEETERCLKLFPNIKRIWYEDLVSKPNEILQELSDFVGLKLRDPGIRSDNKTSWLAYESFYNTKMNLLFDTKNPRRV